MRKLFASFIFALVLVLGLGLTLPVSAQTITSPVPKSTLTGATVKFTWTAVSGATQYQELFGTKGVGSADLDVFNTPATATSITPTNLPTTGGTVYVRLYWLANGKWGVNDFTFTAFNGTTPPPPPSTYQVSLSCTPSAQSTTQVPGTTVLSRATVTSGVTGAYSVLTSTAPPACTYVDTTVTFGATYVYKAEATINGVTSNCTTACTNTAQITITSAQLSPTNLVAH